MKVLNYKSTDCANEECADSQCVEPNLSLHFASGFGVESFESKPAKLSSFTAAGAWGFSWANLNLVVESVALQFARVDGSRVVATGCNCGPSAHPLSGGNDGQGVSNIDIDNLVPTDGNRSERVSNHDTFIEDFDLWVNENKVSADASGSGPKSPGCCKERSFGQPKSSHQKGAHCENQTSQQKTASRSKDLFITHVSIIAGEE